MREDRLASKLEFQVCINVSAFLGLRNSVLNFLNILSSRAVQFFIYYFLLKKRACVLESCSIQVLHNKILNF